MADFVQPMSTGGHGGQGSQEERYTRLIKPSAFTALQLPHPEATFGAIVTAGMDQGPDIPPKDDPDPQENPRVPAGYTYFGQFIDHDLTLDTVSTLDDKAEEPNNERTPRLDLDCLYGLGIASAPYMYDGATGKLLTNPNGYDLPRASNDRAIIGDPRNDENSIVCQIQRGFINFHNKVVDAVIARGVKPGAAAFKAARQEVRWTYQSVIMNDYLARIVADDVRANYLESTGDQGKFNLYTRDKWDELPLEFTAAAYRFGHSMVRNAYRLNTEQPAPQLIFDGDDDSATSLVGFGSLDPSHKVNWRLLLPDPADPSTAPGKDGDNTGPNGDKTRLQFAYKLDTSIVNPLLALPSRIAGNPLPANPFRALAARNLMRAYNFRVPSGQDVAKALKVRAMTGDDLAIRSPDGYLTFDKIPGVSAEDAAKLTAHTPLWLYVLMEAQQSIPRDVGFDDNSLATVPTALGPVGGRILLEVFYGVLIADAESVLADPDSEDWKPLANPDRRKLTLWDIFRFAGEIP